MTKTRVGEKGLKISDIEERDRLSQQLTEAFSEVENSINKYQDSVDEINGWLLEIREKFQTYYGDRSKAWQESKDRPTSLYEDFTNEWENFRELEGFDDKLVEMRDSLETWISDLKNLPKDVPRRTKPREVKLFSRELQRKHDL